MDDEMLDLSGLKCPLPALMARRALAGLPDGLVLTLRTTDPLAAVDISHMCGEEGHSIEHIEQAEDHTVFRIRRGPSGNKVA